MATAILPRSPICTEPALLTYRPDLQQLAYEQRGKRICINKGPQRWNGEGNAWLPSAAGVETAGVTALLFCDGVR